MSSRFVSRVKRTHGISLRAMFEFSPTRSSCLLEQTRRSKPSGRLVCGARAFAAHVTTHPRQIRFYSSTVEINPRMEASKEVISNNAYVWKQPKTKVTVTRQEFPIEVVNDMVHVDNKRVPNIWLRDNCQCNSCVHEATKQRLLDTFTIPSDISIKSSSVQANNIRIEWSDGHESLYTKAFLSNAAAPADQKAIIRQGITGITRWGSCAATDPPAVSYTAENLEAGIISRLRRYGFCYIDGVPHPDPLPTKALLESIAFIRPTHYGGFYDFTADLASADLAYTNIALEAHTDTTYFSDPAGLQAFHLLSHTDGEGGASLLVDGFKIAHELYSSDRHAYNILATVPLNSHASGNDGISIQPYRGFPVLQHDPTTGYLLQVRWNSSDRASIELPLDRVEEWYDAARKWDALVKKEENEYWEQLIPGRVLIFDNWRVMHGRSAFTGKRRICGAYINRDDWISRFKTLQYGRETVLEHLATG